MQAARNLAARIDARRFLSSRAGRISLAVFGAALCLGGLALIWAALRAWPNYPAGTDLALYLRSADALPGNPFDPAVNSGFDRYGYPPLLVDVLAGLKAVLGWHGLLAVWPWLCVAGLAGAVVVLTRKFGVKLPWAAVAIVLGVILLGRVVRSDIVQGQVNVFTLLMFTSGILLRSQGRIIAASLAFAVMMSLKPFMGAVAIYFLMRGDWRMMRWMLGMGAVVFAASFLTSGLHALEAFTDWRATNGYFTSQPFVSKPDNQAAYALALRLFTVTPYSTPWIDNAALVPVFFALAAALAAGLSVTGLYLGGRRGVKPDLGPAPAVMLLECCMVVSLIKFCGPLTEGNHMLFSIAGLTGALIVGAERLRRGTPAARLWIATIAAWGALVFFVVYPRILPFAYGIYDYWHGLHGIEILVSGRCAILLALAGGLTAVTLLRERKAAAAIRPAISPDSCAGEALQGLNPTRLSSLGIGANQESNDNTRGNGGLKTVDGAKKQGFGGSRRKGRK